MFKVFYSENIYNMGCGVFACSNIYTLFNIVKIHAIGFLRNRKHQISSSLYLFSLTKNLLFIWTRTSRLNICKRNLVLFYIQTLPTHPKSNKWCNLSAYMCEHTTPSPRDQPPSPQRIRRYRAKCLTPRAWRIRRAKQNPQNHRKSREHTSIQIMASFASGLPSQKVIANIESLISHLVDYGTGEWRVRGEEEEEEELELKWA